MAPSIVRIIGLANGRNSPFIRPFDFGKDIEAFLNGDGNLEFAYDLPEDVTRIARVCTFPRSTNLLPISSSITHSSQLPTLTALQ